MPVLVPCNEETPLAPLVQDDEELVEYEATPRTQQYGARQGFSARGGRKSANGNLPNKISIK